jgi:hypothetical protein
LQWDFFEFGIFSKNSKPKVVKKSKKGLTLGKQHH